MKISFADVEQAEKNSGGKDYKEGRYEVRITKVSEGTAKSGTPYLEVEFETTTGDIFKVRNRFYKSSKALTILLNFLGAVGLYEGKPTEIEFDNNDLLGSILSVEFVKGEPNENGKRYLEYVPWSAQLVDSVISSKATVNKISEDDSEQIPF